MTSEAVAKKQELLVTPLPGRILVEEDRPVKMVGRIHIPDQHQKIPSVGTVVAIGTGTTTPLKVGDRIVYNLYSGTAIAVKGMTRRYRTIQPEEALVCLERSDIEIEEVGS
jgi:co-chaperonin GroES (HSP10)